MKLSKKANSGGQISIFGMNLKRRNMTKQSVISRYHKDRDGRRANPEGQTSLTWMLEPEWRSVCPAHPSLALLGLWALPRQRLEPLRTP